jgi:formate hydrogenlyase subunit 3/multisubunit Na+/H+ antiporter MnhD subunit
VERVVLIAGAIAMAGMPPLSGFAGKLLILQAARDHMATVWPVILVTSLLMILGFAAAGSTLFWKAHASARDPETGLIVIKPSGVLFEELTPENMVVVDADGNVVEAVLGAEAAHPRGGPSVGRGFPGDGHDLGP